MFVTRQQNENAIYEQQTAAAAAKPLNQGLKGLAAKTPATKASKTPFRVPLNDENAVFGGGKTRGKGKDGVLFNKGEGSKAEQSAFHTPSGPRNRAPLGNKTTNIKATSLLTPAIQTHEKPLSAKPTSPRLRRAKVKIHQAEADPLDDEGSEHEIEYMPPRGEPLPDYPDDWPHDRTYPQFEGKNLTRGCWLEFRPDKDPEELSDFDEKLKKIEERERKKAKTLTKAAEGHGTLQARKPVDSRPAPATLSSKYAAAALSSGPKPTVRSRGAPSFAAPTAATKARFPPALASKKPAATTAAPGNARHTAAKVSSNTTLGYSKGRVISGAARAPFTGAASKPVDGVAAKKDEMAKKDLAGGSTVLDELFSSGSLSEDSSEDDDAALSGNVAALDLDTEDDDLAAFQLPAVDLT